MVATVAREITLFAAIGFLVGGIDDLAVDLVYVVRAARRRLGGHAPTTLDALPPATMPTAVMIAAWDEAAVIGAMLRTACARWAGAPVAIYVGVYPNDWATIEAVAEVAEVDRRVRMVIGNRAGPTTKADCLNTVWRALVADEAHEGTRYAAIALHDAEDVVHPGELRVFEHCLARFDAVQLPVLPLPHPTSRFVGGTYLDEFAEAHAKTLIVRQAVGAGMPFAGVGCAIRRDLLGRIAAARGGVPFDAGSLTEDYELGLTIAEMGGRVALSHVVERAGGLPVAVRALFPGTLPDAERQKARWMTGIALAGWDRTGWGRSRNLLEYWMRMRDRRAPLALIVLLAAYLAAVAHVLGWTVHSFGGPGMAPLPDWLVTVLWLNLAILLWRLAMRIHFTGRIYGTREALRSPARMIVGNLIALVAARRAAGLYWRSLRGIALRWDKTAHQFPAAPEAAS